MDAFKSDLRVLNNEFCPVSARDLVGPLIHIALRTQALIAVFGLFGAGAAVAQSSPPVVPAEQIERTLVGRDGDLARTEGPLQGGAALRSARALQGEGPLQGAGPLQSSESLEGAGPLLGAGPLQGGALFAAGLLQGAGPLIGAGPLQGAAPLVSDDAAAVVGPVDINVGSAPAAEPALTIVSLPPAVPLVRAIPQPAEPGVVATPVPAAPSSPPTVPVTVNGPSPPEAPAPQFSPPGACLSCTIATPPPTPQPSAQSKISQS